MSELDEAGVEAAARAVKHEANLRTMARHKFTKAELDAWDEAFARAAITAYQQATAPTPTPEGAREGEDIPSTKSSTSIHTDEEFDQECEENARLAEVLRRLLDGDITSPLDLAAALDGPTTDYEAKRHELWMARRDAFTDCLSDYERLRGYLSIRYEDALTQTEINTWMAVNGHGLFVEGVPEADEWWEQFWPMSKPKEGDGTPE